MRGNDNNNEYTPLLSSDSQSNKQKNDEKKSTSRFFLPNDVLRQIIVNLNEKGLAHLEGTCKSFREENNNLVRLAWENIAYETFPSVSKEKVKKAASIKLLIRNTLIQNKMIKDPREKYKFEPPEPIDKDFFKGIGTFLGMISCCAEGALILSIDENYSILSMIIGLLVGTLFGLLICNIPGFIEPIREWRYQKTKDASEREIKKYGDFNDRIIPDKAEGTSKRTIFDNRISSDEAGEIDLETGDLEQGYPGLSFQ